MARDFEQTMREHGRALSRVASVYADREADRQDLLQDISLAVWQALGRFEGRSSLRTFLFRVAHNRGVRFLAKQQFYRRAQALPELEDPAASPERRAMEGEAGRHLQRAITRLELGQRQVLTLALEGLSQREIGDVLGVREGTVSVRLHRAKAALRKDMGIKDGR